MNRVDGRHAARISGSLYGRAVTLWIGGVAAALVVLVASFVLKLTGEKRPARFAVALSVGALVVALPVAVAGEIRYRRCVEARAGEGLRIRIAGVTPSRPPCEEIRRVPWS